MREASTKPIAATVLPAPVACSNQKRLPAFGSSTIASSMSVSISSGATSGSSSGSTSATSSASSSSASSSSSANSSSSAASSAASSSSSASPSSSSSIAKTGAAPSSSPSAAVAICEASSAVSVPERASTWWGLSVVPSARWGSSSLRSRSSPSSSDHLRRHCVVGSFSPASISASASVSAWARGVPGASATAASSPSWTNCSRVKASARPMSASLATGPPVAAVGESAIWQSRSIRRDEARTRHCAGSLAQLQEPGPRRQLLES